MQTSMSSSIGFSKDFLIKSLLVCGILSSSLYVGMNIFVAMQDANYSATSQTVSELSAIGAPTRSLWVYWSFAYTFLVVAFGWGIILSSEENHRMRLMGALIVFYGALGLGWPFVPMHTRDVLAAGGGTFSDTLHLIFSAITVCLMLLALGFGAVTFGKAFRIYSIVTILVLATFGMLTGIDAPNVEANMPTPLIGVWERINIGVFLLWVVVVAVILLRRRRLGEMIV
jgi:Protein of unknown function (DUF998)